MEQRETPIIADNIIQKYIIKPLQLFWNPKIKNLKNLKNLNNKIPTIPKLIF